MYGLRNLSVILLLFAVGLQKGVVSDRDVVVVITNGNLCKSCAKYQLFVICGGGLILTVLYGFFLGWFFLLGTIILCFLTNILDGDESACVCGVSTSGQQLS